MIFKSFLDEMHKIAASMKALRAGAKRVGRITAKDPTVQQMIGFTIPTKGHMRKFKKHPQPESLARMLPRNVAEKVDGLHGGHPGRIVQAPRRVYRDLGTMIKGKPVSKKGSKAFRDMTTLHEGFERSVKTPDWSSMGHLSPEVLIKEHNMLSKATGPGSRSAREIMRTMREKGGETSRLKGQFMEAFKDPRALQYLEEGQKVPKAMRKAFLKKKRKPMSAEEVTRSAQGLNDHITKNFQSLMGTLR